MSLNMPGVSDEKHAKSIGLWRVGVPKLAGERLDGTFVLERPSH